MVDVKTIVDAMDESKDCQLKKSFEVKQVTETHVFNVGCLTCLIILCLVYDFLRRNKYGPLFYRDLYNRFKEIVK
jgi:hypothetical protein